MTLLLTEARIPNASLEITSTSNHINTEPGPSNASHLPEVCIVLYYGMIINIDGLLYPGHFVIKQL